jgi:MFS family permease
MRKAGGMETTTATRPQEETHTGPAALALMCTGYFMLILDGTVTNVALPSIGQRIFTAGLLLFGAASAACGLAPTLGVLVAARLAQGLGAAILVPSSLLLLQAAFTDPEARPARSACGAASPPA